MIFARRLWFLQCVVLGVFGLASGVGALDWLHYQPYPELESRTVEQVLVFGNNHTNPVVVLREMRLAVGSRFTSDDLWLDWERIVDLGLFANVEVEAVASGDGVLVVVSVYERPRWFAAPILDYDLDDRTITGGFRVRLRNLDGFNRQFRGKLVYGGRDSFSASWSTPWVGDRRQTLSADLRIDLPGSSTDELRSTRLTLSTTKFLGDFKEIRRGVTPFAQLEALRRDGTAPGGRVNQLTPSIGIAFSRDSRNVRVDPSRGSLFSIGGEYAVGWTTDELSYIRSAIDGRVFRSFGPRLVAAARGRTIVSRGEVPGYRKLGVGGKGSIRGQDDDVAVGDNIAAGSFELRFPILGKRRFSLPIPLVPQRVRNFDIRFDGVLFADVGTAWNDRDELRRAHVRKGAGFGLRIFLPILELARLELAFDERGNPTLYFREGNLI